MPEKRESGRQSSRGDQLAQDAARAILAILPNILGIADQAVREHGAVSLERVKALWALAQRPMRGTDLSHWWHVTRPAVTEVVRALEAKGLVRRQADPRDRRNAILSVTAAGARELARFDTAVTSAVAEVVSQLDGKAQRSVRDACTELRRFFAEQTTHPTRSRKTALRGNRNVSKTRTRAKQI